MSIKKIKLDFYPEEIYYDSEIRSLTKEDWKEWFSHLKMKLECVDKHSKGRTIYAIEAEKMELSSMKYSYNYYIETFDVAKILMATTNEDTVQKMCRDKAFIEPTPDSEEFLVSSEELSNKLHELRKERNKYAHHEDVKKWEEVYPSERVYLGLFLRKEYLESPTPYLRAFVYPLTDKNYYEYGLLYYMRNLTAKDDIEDLCVEIPFEKFEKYIRKDCKGYLERFKIIEYNANLERKGDESLRTFIRV